MPAGRPSDYTEDLGDSICSQIAQGKSLVKICSPANMPCTATVYAWLRTHDEFLKNYERAKSDQADYLVEEMLDIADEAEPENVQVQRLRVDTRKWAASKFKPKKYGDRLQTDNTNKNYDMSEWSDEDIDRRLEQLQDAD